MSYESNDTLLVEVLNDACHGWRKNTAQIGIICLGNKSVVTAVDDACAQRHKTVGTKRIYTALEQQGVRMRKHAREKKQQ